MLQTRKNKIKMRTTLKNLSVYKKSNDMVTVYITLTDEKRSIFEGSIKELEDKMLIWSGRPNVTLTSMVNGVNPLCNINFY